MISWKSLFSRVTHAHSQILLEALVMSRTFRYQLCRWTMMHLRHNTGFDMSHVSEPPIFNVVREMSLSQPQLALPEAHGIQPTDGVKPMMENMLLGLSLD